MRAGSFGEDAEQYDRSRPTYPSALADDLLEGGVSRVLDVGVGTGIVSRLFAAKGCRVLGIEPDERMAALARRYGISVEPGTFEDWPDRGRRFDLVVSGQAWHWIDPVVGAAKAATVLRPRGRVGLFWNQGVHRSPLKEALEDAYRRSAPSLARDSIAMGFMEDGRFERARDTLAATGSFEAIEIRTYRWTRRYSTAQWLDQLPTHSDHRTLPADRLAVVLREVGRAIDDAGGTFEMDYLSWLVTARRSAPGQAASRT
jgi:SAM-dependent methyltransferase